MNGLAGGGRFQCDEPDDAAGGHDGWERVLPVDFAVAKRSLEPIWGVLRGTATLQRMFGRGLKNGLYYVDFTIGGSESLLTSPSSGTQVLKVQCPECRQRSWYSLKDADYNLHCPQCLSNFRLPEHSPKDIVWAYRAIGPFSLPRRAYGVYSVLLTLRFFTRLLDGATTPMLSFTAKKAGLDLEADLGLFFQKSKYTHSRTDLIFAECKTFGRFKAKDVTRMAALAKEFPGAILVFATLRKTLSNAEKRILRPIVNRGRRYWKAERPHNPVLILTGAELFADDDPRDVWKDLGGNHATHAPSWGDGRDLVGLADATQQIYLDMRPWQDRFRRGWEKKKLRQAKTATPQKPEGDFSPGANAGEKIDVSFPVAMRQVPWR